MTADGNLHSLPRNQRTWVSLSPALLAALEELAAKEGQSLEALLVHLITEALVGRLNRRF